LRHRGVEVKGAVIQELMDITLSLGERVVRKANRVRDSEMLNA
jgi:hypothetical protein